MDEHRKKDLTDSGVQRAIAEAAERLSRDKTPTPSSESSERMRAIAREEAYKVAETVVVRERPAAQYHCEREGPVAKVSSRFDQFERETKVWRKEMTERVGKHESFIDQYLGEQRYKRILQPLLIGVIGSAIAIAAQLLFKVRL